MYLIITAVLDLNICKTESSTMYILYIFTRVYLKLKCVFLSRYGISNTSSSIANKCYLGFVFGRGDAYENQFNVYLPAAIEL